MDPKQNPAGRSRLSWSLLFLAAVIPALSACFVAAGGPIHDVEGPYTTEELYYSEAPPPPRNEVVIGVAPSATHVWVSGYWTRHRDGWHWVEGRWASRPHHTSVWVSGHWDRHPRGYVWVRGHWQNK